MYMYIVHASTYRCTCINMALTTYHQYVSDRLREANDVHGNGHRIRSGEDQTNGATELRAQTARDHVVSAT